MHISFERDACKCMDFLLRVCHKAPFWALFCSHVMLMILSLLYINAEKAAHSFLTNNPMLMHPVRCFDESNLEIKVMLLTSRDKD